MIKIITCSLVILFLLSTQTTIAQEKNTLRYEIMLSGNMMEPSLKKDRFINTIDISPDKFITLSSGNIIYMLGWGGMTQFGKETDSTIDSFAFASDGLLMAVKNNELCYMDDKGSFSVLAKLPGSNMGIAAGKDVMYLFDQKRNDRQYKLYVYAKGGKYKQLLVSPEPVIAAVEMNDSLIWRSEAVFFLFHL